MNREPEMKLLGLLLLPAGWGIVISAVVLFPKTATCWSFVAAGLCIEIAGLALALIGTRYPKEAED